MNERVREMLPLAAWVAALVGAVVAFTAMGSGPLAAPALTDPGSWSAWAVGKDPVVATAAVLRLVVLLLAWYLLGATTVGAVARLARLTAMVRVADALSVPVVRRVLQTSLGVSLATAVAVSSTSVTGSRPGPAPMMAAAAQDVAAEAEGPAPPRMRPLPPREATAQMPTPPEPAQTPTPPDPAAATVPASTREPRPDDTEPPATPTPPRETPAPGDASVTGVAATPEHREAPPPADATTDTPDATGTSAATDTSTVTVRPGDHLWSIAEQHLAARGTPPAEDRVAAYWRRLIEANRDQLVDPTNPDLILPGQQFVLPADPDDDRPQS